MVCPTTHDRRPGVHRSGAVAAGIVLILAGAAFSAAVMAEPAPNPARQPVPASAAPSAADPEHQPEQQVQALQATVDALRRALEQRDQEIASLRARLDAQLDAEARLTEHLQRLRARLPAIEGGSLTAAEARARAQDDARRLLELVRQGQGINNPQLRRQQLEAEIALHRSQFQLARADDARTVYRVRPGDSLNQLSLMFYGDADRWDGLFDANRHVLEDPYQLPPGVTLVVP
ncbi:hypothetical protein F2Q65_14300 [Thiohalocapsa marina]|uniref:LysM domain-containing protein n=1 Tax=Thiohalocapsa marina TaxID=424902 RepID=A0A5M8FRF9_9GAMM|nr:hypothetical protein [Thiohalocapsa marina]KAA6183832.1 hypothetical protein F2Q65_14300 [Thiohalocapsa marina]